MTAKPDSQKLATTNVGALLADQATPAHDQHKLAVGEPRHHPALYRGYIGIMENENYYVGFRDIRGL